MYCRGNTLIACHLLCRLLVREIGNVAAVGLHTVVLFLRANNNLLPLAKTCTCRDEVTRDNVLLHTLEVVYLTTDSSLVEKLG